jgi:O-antigen ligase
MWETGWKMFLEHPVAGVGDSKFNEVYRSYKIPEYDAEGSHLHNNFMMILATTGMLGFLTFCGFFFSLLYLQVRIMNHFTSELEKALVLGSIMVIVSFLISGIFEWSFGDHEVMTVFFFLISVPFIVNKKGKEEISNELHSS